MPSSFAVDAPTLTSVPDTSPYHLFFVVFPSPVAFHHVLDCTRQFLFLFWGVPRGCSTLNFS